MCVHMCVCVCVCLCFAAFDLRSDHLGSISKRFPGADISGCLVTRATDDGGSHTCALLWHSLCCQGRAHDRYTQTGSIQVRFLRAESQCAYQPTVCVQMYGCVCACRVPTVKELLVEGKLALGSLVAAREARRVAKIRPYRYAKFTLSSPMGYPLPPPPPGVPNPRLTHTRTHTHTHTHSFLHPTLHVTDNEV